MYNRLLRHLIGNNILVEEKFGFGKNLTTNKATNELIHEIVSVRNDKLIVGGIFYDLAQVYDCVN